MTHDEYRALDVEGKLRFWIDNPTARIAIDVNTTFGRDDEEGYLLHKAMKEFQLRRERSRGS